MKKTKLNFSMLLLCLCITIVTFSSCSDDETINTPLTQIDLSESEILLGLGEVFQFVVSATPEDATSPKVIWSSSNEDIAQVQANPNGLVAGVKGISTGEAILTAKISDSDIEQTVMVSVQRIYCNASGSGVYNAETVTTIDGTTNIQHSGQQPEGSFGFYEDEILSVSPGSSFTLEIEQSNTWSRTMVWIDWDGNGNFTDDGGAVVVFGSGNQLNNGPFSSIINVPSDVALGAIRMRVVTGDAWTYNDIPLSVCGELIHSSTKDFIVEIL